MSATDMQVEEGIDSSSAVPKVSGSVQIDVPILPNVPDAFQCNFQVKQTTQGKPKLIHRGYEFVMAYSSKKNPLKYWRCGKRGSCGARAVLQDAGQLILTKPHNHYCGGSRFRELEPTNFMNPFYDDVTHSQ